MAFDSYLIAYYSPTTVCVQAIDSSTEQDFSYVLETDNSVLRWLRPAPNQFNIYWGNGIRKYEPDFIVETDDAIYMIETKASKDANNEEVREKRAAAELYCERATEFATANGDKSWRYIMLRHDLVTRPSSFNYLVQQNYIP